MSTAEITEAESPTWRSRHNDLTMLAPENQEEARRICAATTKLHAPGNAPCTDKNFVCYRCQDLAAQAIEARRAETANAGSVHESAVPEGDAPKGDQP